MKFIQSLHAAVCGIPIPGREVYYIFTLLPLEVSQWVVDLGNTAHVCARVSVHKRDLREKLHRDPLSHKCTGKSQVYKVTHSYSYPKYDGDVL